MSALNRLFQEELSDRLDSEKQLVLAIPKLSKLATCKTLKVHFECHLKETESHVKRLETILRSLEKEITPRKCEATAGLLKESILLAADFKGSPAINAALISSAQKIIHYEIASYGCLNSWAKVLNNTVVAGMLEQILKEERAENESLIKLAESTCNEEALAPCNTEGICAEDKIRKTTHTTVLAPPIKGKHQQPVTIVV